MERTLLLLKPDAFQRGLVSNLIVHLWDSLGTEIKWVKDRLVLSDQLQDLIPKHYEEHVGKPFYGRLVGFMQCGPILAVHIEGEDVVNLVRKYIGSTDCAEADPRSVRGLFGDLDSPYHENLVHASDSVESAERELKLWGFV